MLHLGPRYLILKIMKSVVKLSIALKERQPGQTVY
jgi:hypothetical protein